MKEGGLSNMNGMTFEIMDGTEPYCVVDLDTGGCCWFHDKLKAYKYAAYLVNVLDHNYRLEVL